MRYIVVYKLIINYNSEQRCGITLFKLILCDLLDSITERGELLFNRELQMLTDRALRFYAFQSNTSLIFIYS